MVDLPPGTGDVVLTALGALPIDGVVLVTTPYPTSVGDTGRSAALFEEGVPVLETAVNMCGFTCECGREHDLFPEGDPAEALDQPVLAELPSDDAIRDTDGPSPAPIEEFAGEVVERLENRPTEFPAHALDLRGIPAPIRREQAREEFLALDPGETFYLIETAPPSRWRRRSLRPSVGSPHDERLRPVRCRRRGPNEWVLALSRPAARANARS